MEYSRRFVIKTILSSLATTALPQSVFSKTSIHKSTSSEEIIWGNGTTINRINLATKKIDSQYVGAACHGFLKVPNHPDLVLTIEKWRSRMVKVDLKEPKNSKKIYSGFDSRFYGHAQMLPDNENFATIMVHNTTKVTTLAIFNFQTMKMVDRYDIGLGGGHEMGLLPDQRHLVVALTGWVPFIGYGSTALNNFQRVDFSKLVYIDLKTMKIVDEQHLLNTRLSLAHLKVAADGRVFTISDIMHSQLSRVGAGGIHTSTLNGKIVDLHVPRATYLQLMGEFLSVEINPKKPLLAVTNPYGGKVLVFDTNTYEMIASIHSNTTGVAWSSDGERLYILDRDPHVGIIPIRTPMAKQVSDLFKVTYFTDVNGVVSSHMLYSQG